MLKLVAPIVLLAALTIGCSSTDGDVDKDPPAGTNAQTEGASATEEPAESETPEEEPTQAAQPSFGDSYSWDDGLTVTISTPKPYKPSDSAAVGKGSQHIAFEITLVNNTGAIFDPSLVSNTLQSGNSEAEQIFDSANGLEGSPVTKLLNGREAKWTVGYTVQDPADLVLELAPDYDHQGVLFVN